MITAVPACTQGIELTVLKPAHIEGALHCLAEAFLDEPIISTSGVSYQALKDFLRPRIERTAEDGLSFVAVEKGQVVSVLFSDDNDEAPVPYPNQAQWEPQFAPIFDLLGRLHAESPIEQQMHAEGLRFYHIFFGGTLKEARKKGYLKHLMAMALDWSRAKGFQVAMVEATSPGSQHTCRSFGFTLAHKIVYADVPFLSALGGQAALELYLLRL